MRRLLFVDDETSVLDGLRDLLRTRRREWEMVFASGAHEALVELEKAPFDVVVSDMRMRRMDGAMLLSELRDRWPGTVRIILSGQIDPESTERVIAVAHQVLSKPCDAAMLAATIEHTLAVVGILGSQCTRDAMGRIQSLPALPEVHTRIVRLLRDERASSEDVARLVEQDMALAARVLQLANSGFFGLPRRLTRVADAVGFLGLRTVESLSLSLAVFDPASSPHGMDMAAMQRHAMQVGSIARALVDDSKLRDEAFVAGMLHDVGSVLIASHLRERFQATLEELARAPRPLHELELERWGVTHAEMGAYLLGLWNLPFRLVEAVAVHHRLDPVRPSSLLAVVVHAADALAHELGRAPCPIERAAPPLLDLAYLESVGLLDRVDAWRELARARGETLEEAA